MPPISPSPARSTDTRHGSGRASTGTSVSVSGVATRRCTIARPRVASTSSSAPSTRIAARNAVTSVPRSRSVHSASAASG